MLDALLVATGAVADLADPDRMRPWLLALTRNECLRRGCRRRGRGRGGRAGPARARPVRRRRAARVRAGRAAPAGAAGAAFRRTGCGPSCSPPPVPRRVAFRAELTRRARPFEPDGFPIPLDRRRLSGKVLAWSAAAVVVIALGLLVALPTKGNAGSSAAAPAGAAEAAAPSAAAAPAQAADDPVPTLGQAPFGSAGGASASVGPAPSTAVAAEADAGARSPATRAPSTAAAPRRGPTRPAAGPATVGSIEVSWSAASRVLRRDLVRAPARDHRRRRGLPGDGGAPGPARWSRCSRDGDGWSGDLTGLPTDRTVTVTVFADGPVRPGSARLRAGC